MRKQRLYWSISVFGIIGTIYGAYLLFYHLNHNNKFSAGALVLLIFGLLALAASLILFLSYYIIEKKNKDIQTPPVEEKVIQEEKIEPVIEKKEEVKVAIKKEDYVPKTQRTKVSYSSYSVSTVYVKQVGYGPLLRVDGNRILDMRTNTYYRIEDNLVKQEGYGPVFEIRGNQIKNAFGGYLYELSGSNINKVFGGFYASISGNYITLYDLSVKYELTDSLSKKQILAISALLFGNY